MTLRPGGSDVVWAECHHHVSCVSMNLCLSFQGLWEPAAPRLDDGLLSLCLMPGAGGFESCIPAALEFGAVLIGCDGHGPPPVFGTGTVRRPDGFVSFPSYIDWTIRTRGRQCRGRRAQCPPLFKDQPCRDFQNIPFPSPCSIKAHVCAGPSGPSAGMSITARTGWRGINHRSGR